MSPRVCREYEGITDAIEAWNAETEKFFAEDSVGFHFVDMHRISVRLRHLILRDCVHFEPPVYSLQLAVDLNIIFRGMRACW